MLVPGAFFSGRRGSRVSFLKILSHKCRSFLLADMRIRLRMAPLCKIPPQRFGVTGGGVSPECQRADKRAREDKQRETKFEVVMKTPLLRLQGRRGIKAPAKPPMRHNPVASELADYDSPEPGRAASEETKT